MNPTFLLASIAAALIKSAQAGYIYIYSPYASTQCQPGTPCAISWHVSHDGPVFDRVDIELLAGEAHNARVVAPIVLGYDLSEGNTFLWNVPQGSIAEGDYFIRIKGVNTDYQSYSHSFPIGFGPHPNPTIVPTVTPTSTATPTGSTSGVVSPTRTGSALSSISSVKKSSTAAASTSTSSAMSVQGSVSVAAAVIAAAFAIMMF